MIKRLANFVFDNNSPAVLDLVNAHPDPDLAARNAARIEAAKRALGDKYILAKPIKPNQEPVDWLNRKESSSNE